MMSENNEHHENATADKNAASGNAAKDEKNLENMSEEELLSAIEQEAAADKDGGSGSGFSDPLQALAAENDKLDAEIAELKDKILRATAEMENLRRRTQKDVADARAYSIAGFAREMLGVSDNLRRAIEHVDEKDMEQSGLKSLVEGVEMTERELLAALEKNGVKKISPLNEKFDPHFHQAMFEVQNPDVPNNTVSEVVQIGFVIGERVLRPAMVGVAKGGPKISAVETETPESEEQE